jgi:hypothetical protein
VPDLQRLTGLSTWLVIERKPKGRSRSGPGETVYDVERNGRAFAYDLDLAQARSRITRNRRFDRTADKVILVRADGGRETLVLRGHT